MFDVPVHAPFPHLELECRILDLLVVILRRVVQPGLWELLYEPTMNPLKDVFVVFNAHLNEITCK